MNLDRHLRESHAVTVAFGAEADTIEKVHREQHAEGFFRDGFRHDHPEPDADAGPPGRP